MALAHFYDVDANKVSAWLERVHAKESSKQQKSKPGTEEQRVARQKKQKLVNGERRVSMEGIVDTTYLKRISLFFATAVPRCKGKCL